MTVVSPVLHYTNFTGYVYLAHQYVLLICTVVHDTIAGFCDAEN